MSQSAVPEREIERRAAARTPPKAGPTPPIRGSGHAVKFAVGLAGGLVNVWLAGTKLYPSSLGVTV